MAPSLVAAKKQKSATKAAPKKFYIDYSGPVNDKIFDAADFEKYMVEHYKVDGKRANLDGKVEFKREPTRLVVIAHDDNSKRSLKYYSKKYLKKNMMREWLRVVATSKDTYTFKFFNLSFEDGEEA
ncbi:hypothetical protein BMF94_2612 [Rhodotorula taiwanensis]|uniref:Ribosomal protein L22e n=1 Tax=Rhodotorula taiwanensis TaxID=741276 RepID=A0A2S5BCD2_9BASI|nr:hypothetical protein BMF94_2612 [Rhodotorula taiwanensis]